MLIHTILVCFTTDEQELCSTYREVLGIVNPLSKYEQINIGYDHFNIVSNDQFLAFSPTKEPFWHFFTVHKRN